MGARRSRCWRDASAEAVFTGSDLVRSRERPAERVVRAAARLLDQPSREYELEARFRARVVAHGLLDPEQRASPVEHQRADDVVEPGAMREPRAEPGRRRSPALPTGARRHVAEQQLELAERLAERGPVLEVQRLSDPSPRRAASPAPPARADALVPALEPVDPAWE